MADNKNTIQVGHPVAKTPREGVGGVDATKRSTTNFVKTAPPKSRPSVNAGRAYITATRKQPAKAQSIKAEGVKVKKPKEPVLVAATQQAKPALRPIGLAEGEFVVPANFNDPLPDDLLMAFNGL